MDNDATISKVMEAIEIADRIEKLKKFVGDQMRSMQYKEGALTCVDIEHNTLQNYFHYIQISNILYCITRPDKDWNVGRCCGDIFTELRQ